VALPYQVFKAYDMSGKFLAGPVSVIEFFGSKMGGRFTNAACERPIWPLHSNPEMTFFERSNRMPLFWDFVHGAKNNTLACTF
jgi:hypothetical protein